MYAIRIKSNSSGKLLKDHFNFSTLLYVVWTEIKGVHKNGEFVIFCICLIDEEVCKKNTKLKCFIYRCQFYATKKGFNKQLTLLNIEVVNVEKNSESSKHKNFHSLFPDTAVSCHKVVFVFNQPMNCYYFSVTRTNTVSCWWFGLVFRSNY